MTRTAFEAALDRGLLETRVIGREGHKWYRCRRNGRTRTWKRQPDRFEIPIKFRFRDYLLITDTYFNSGAVDEWFRITQESQ